MLTKACHSLGRLGLDSDQRKALVFVRKIKGVNTDGVARWGTKDRRTFDNLQAEGVVDLVELE